MEIKPKNIKTILFSRTPLRSLWTKWRRTRVMIPQKKFLPGSKNLFNHHSTVNFWRQCLIIIGNFSDWKISNKYWSRKQNREGCPFLKYFRVKRKSCMRKPRKWRISTVGSYLLTRALEIKMILTHIVSCSISQKSFKIKKPTAIFMRQWWSSQRKCSKPLSTSMTSPS